MTTLNLNKFTTIIYGPNILIQKHRFVRCASDGIFVIRGKILEVNRIYSRKLLKTPPACACTTRSLR